MVFKKLMQRFGVGGPSVDTVLSRADTQPGRELTGDVNIIGGDHDTTIEYVRLALAVRAEFEGSDREGTGTIEIAELHVSGGFRLAAGESRTIPFRMPVPWQTPVTTVTGQPLHGMAMGLRTDLAVSGAVDKGDLDPVRVHPLASQEAVLEAFDALGCGVKHADVETGHIPGTPQHRPYYQEIEYFPAPQFHGRVNEVELTFVADADELHVVLEADRNGGMFGGGGDDFGRWRLRHPDAEEFDWAGAINEWLTNVAARSAHYGPSYPEPHHEHGGGIGVGGMVAGAAAGIVGGIVAGEIIDEVGDAFFGED